MDAIILAAGRGTRMRELTKSCPKPLLPLQGRPILEWTLRALRPCADRALVVCGWQKEQVAAYMARQRIFDRYELVEQAQLLGTGDAFRACREVVVGDDFLALNGDDLFHAPSLQSLAAGPAGLLTIPRDDGSQYGVLISDAGGRLLRLHEKPPPDLYSPPVLVNIGAYHLTREIFDLPLERHVERGEYELTDLVSGLTRRRPLAIHECPFWHPLGTPEDLIAAQSLDLGRVMFS